jgi:flagellar biosynthetic protein FlhB
VPDKPAQEKTEPATPRKRQEARKEGKVAKSQELSSVIILLASIGAMYFVMPSSIERISEFARWLLANAPEHVVTQANFSLYFKHAMMTFVMAAGPIVLVLVVVGMVANLLQVGIVFSAKPLEPKFEKIDPIKGTAKLLSAQALFNLVKDIVKIAIIGLVGYYAIASEMKHGSLLPELNAPQMLGFIGAAMFRVAIKCSLVLIILAVIDYAFQRYQYEKQLRMTKQEIKDEMKNTEGNPQIKGRIRQLQREQSYSRMMTDVPKANVVVTNPTHIAVAMSYDVEKMDAPTVVAMGQRLIAERIKEIALQHDIPIVENKPLARSLFKACEVGMQIPASLFRAVAEVLAYVYKLKGQV